MKVGNSRLSQFNFSKHVIFIVNNTVRDVYTNMYVM